MKSPVGQQTHGSSEKNSASRFDLDITHPISWPSWCTRENRSRLAVRGHCQQWGYPWDQARSLAAVSLQPELRPYRSRWRRVRGCRRGSGRGRAQQPLREVKRLIVRSSLSLSDDRGGGGVAWVDEIVRHVRRKCGLCASAVRLVPQKP